MWRTKCLWCTEARSAHWCLQSVSGPEACSGWGPVLVVCLEPLEKLVKCVKHLASEAIPIWCDCKVLPQWLPRGLVSKDKFTTKLLAWTEIVRDFGGLGFLLFCQKGREFVQVTPVSRPVILVTGHVSHIAGHRLDEPGHYFIQVLVLLKGRKRRGGQNAREELNSMKKHACT